MVNNGSVKVNNVEWGRRWIINWVSHFLDISTCSRYSCWSVIKPEQKVKSSSSSSSSSSLKLKEIRMPKQGNPSIMLKKAILISKEKTFNLLKNLTGFAPRRKMYFLRQSLHSKWKCPLICWYLTTQLHLLNMLLKCWLLK